MCFMIQSDTNTSKDLNKKVILKCWNTKPKYFIEFHNCWLSEDVRDFSKIYWCDNCLVNNVYLLQFTNINISLKNVGKLRSTKQLQSTKKSILLFAYKTPSGSRVSGKLISANRTSSLFSQIRAHVRGLQLHKFSNNIWPSHPINK